MPLVRIDYEKILVHHVKSLEKLQSEGGLFLASPQGVGTGYDKAWLRDNFYECLAFEYVGRWDKRVAKVLSPFHFPREGRSPSRIGDVS